MILLIPSEGKGLWEFHDSGPSQTTQEMVWDDGNWGSAISGGHHAIDNDKQFHDGVCRIMLNLISYMHMKEKER